MDRDRRRQLKALGKAEVARESAALHASLRQANPAKPGDDQWADHYRLGVKRERWLRHKLPLLRAEELIPCSLCTPGVQTPGPPTLAGTFFVAAAAPHPHPRSPAGSSTGRPAVVETFAGGACLAGGAAPSKIRVCSRRSSWSARA